MVLKLNPKKFLYILGGFIFLLLVNLINPGWIDSFSPITAQYRGFYQKARTLQSQGDFKSAYTTYKKIPSFYSAYDIVLLQQSKCAASFGDEKSAIKNLNSILSYSGSPVKDQASYNLGQAYVRTGNYSKAEKQFLETIKNYPKTNYALGSYYYLGEIYKTTNPQLTLKYWLQYIEKVPDGRFALDIITELKSLQIKKDSNMKKNLGIVLFYDQRYKDAAEFLKSAPLKESWYYLAKASHAIGNDNRALNILKEGIKNYSYKLNQAQIEDAMSLYVQLNNKSRVDSWSELANITKKGRDFVLYRRARLSSGSTATGLYENIIKYYRFSNYASESLWNLFWDRFNSGNYSQAIELGNKHIYMFKNTKASPKILFWMGKVYEKQGNKAVAISYYKKTMSVYPDNYYSFRANGRLKELNSNSDSGWETDNTTIIINASESEMPYTFDEISSKYGRQLAEMLRVQDYETAITLTEDPFIKSWINLKDGLVSRSVVLARNGMNEILSKPAVTDKRWKLIYPLSFVEEINYHAGNNNLDPYIILSIIKEESHFNPLAISSSNARGLMQLLPGTAKDVARWDGLGLIGEFELFTPSKNLKLGSAYFRYVKKKLYNNSLYAVAAYNGGPGAVEKWLSTIPHDDIDQFVENIPYDQTRDYVKKVYTSYWNYKRIYG
ncbi:MAG: transglycosylase SLT domain-containing protein [Candidatus Gastranaerophilales bacterium]|nr:transglycosylase SLT domain-containing protein [Candidatus Gastranaerophilales bacterium]